MIALIQRVKHAHVDVRHHCVAKIQHGLLVFIGVEREDNEQIADKLIKRVLGYRIFSDTQDKMNLSLTDINGGILIVPQFTLPAKTDKGMRPSFTPAAPPEKGKYLFDYFVSQTRILHDDVQMGVFGADMQVSLTNDGPVTFWLQASNHT
jgi:D-tyrosyl-tRNA(Tyr) deacylase